MYKEYSEHCIAAYAGYVKDQEELMQCSSGGMATALAKEMIRRGGYVAGVSYSDDFMEARYEITNSEERLKAFQGSKYVEVNKASVYKDVKLLLDAGKPVLFFGLPCVVAALRTFLKKDYDQLIAVELICNGPTDAKVHRQYVEHLEKKHGSKVVAFSVKKKKDGWIPGYLYAEFADGQVFWKQFYHTEYGYAFSVLGKKQCYTCPFRGNDRTGDIMIGDFWGATESDVFWNKNGVSAVLVHSEKGSAFVGSLEDIVLEDTSFERIVEKNRNVIRPRQARPETVKFETLLRDHDLFYAVKHSRKFRTRVMAVIKKILGK